MVGLQILDLPIGVRVPASQPYLSASARKPQQKPYNRNFQSHLACSKNRSAFRSLLVLLGHCRHENRQNW
jgi:hypothetical protein